MARMAHGDMPPAQAAKVKRSQFDPGAERYGVPVDLIFCSRCGRRLTAGSKGDLCPTCREETGSDLSGRQKLAISTGPIVWLAALAVVAIIAAIAWLIESRI